MNKMQMRTWIPFVAASMLLALVAVRAPLRAETAPPAASKADVAAGSQLWVSYSCHACHGYQAQGAVSGPRVSPAKLPYEALVAIVRRPYGVMPAYSPKVLSDQRLRSIYAYLRTVDHHDQGKPPK